jgi:large subunit ribosomal protein L15
MCAKKRGEKFRGSRTHGRGKKAGRGKGLRGGHGNAGLHKHKFMWANKYLPDHFGRHGFKRPQSVVSSNEVINISTLNEALPQLVQEGLATKKGKTITVDLGEMGIDKLLGNGKVDKPLVIKVSQASKKAISKIEEAGGKVQLDE